MLDGAMRLRGRELQQVAKVAMIPWVDDEKRQEILEWIDRMAEGPNVERLDSTDALRARITVN